jgi:hypothetical protein
MMGQIIESRGRVPIMAIVCLGFAAISVAIGFLDHNDDWLVFAIFPAIVGVAILIGRERKFRMEFRPTDFVVHSTNQAVAYDQIDRIAFVGIGARPSRGFINVFHQSGVVQIPESLNVSVVDVFRFLTSQVPGQVQPVDSSVNPYLDKQIETFGADRVWVHCSRTPYNGKPGRSVIFACAGFILAAIAWCIAASMLHQSVWYIGAVFLVFGVFIAWMLGDSFSRRSDFLGRQSGWQWIAILIGPIGWLIIAVNRSEAVRSKARHPSYLVIGPAGMALEHRDLNGQLRWAELRNLKLKSGLLFSRPTLYLNAEGISIPIHDIYDTPIGEIHQQIADYWKAG